MSDNGMEQAAQAFDAAIRNEKPNGGVPPQKAKSDEGPVERMFKNVGELEVDEDSPPRGGGDDPEEAIYKEETEKGGRTPRKGKEPSEEGPDDDGDDGDGEGAEADEGGDESEEWLAQEVQVTVDGEERTVALKEALEGYIRTETLHKRLNEVEEGRKIVQRAAADASQNYQYMMDLGKQMEAHLNQLVPKEPDWDQEFQKNPQRAREMQKYYEHVRKFRGELKAKMEAASAKQAESDAAQLSAFALAEEQKFDRANAKNWATDPKKKVKDLQAMRRTALAEGFTEEEVGQVYDSRMLNVLLKASKYDRMMAARPKPIVRSGSKQVTPGAGNARQRTAQRGASSAMKRLNRTGSIEDAAMVMDEIIKRG